MWAVPRACKPLQFRKLIIGTSHARHAQSELLNGFLVENNAVFSCPETVNGECLSYYYHYYCCCSSACPKVSNGRRGLSSHAGSESHEAEDELEDGFSELETLDNANESAESSTSDEQEDELVSDAELSDAEEEEAGEASQNALDLSDTETAEKKLEMKKQPSQLCKAIMDASGLSISSVLEKWLADGKGFDRAEIALTMLNLRKRRMFRKALQFSEWLEEKKHLEMGERDYISRLDLIAKVNGVQKAEQYIVKIPQSHRSEIIYRTLLANCVSSNNLKKSEEIFNKMQSMEFPITSFACNQLLLLYKRLDKKKIADVLLLMEKENVKPSLFTYKILIDTKGLSNDISGMDQIVETMKSDGIKLDTGTQALLAKHYVSGGLKERAEEILKEMEGGNLNEHRWACRALLPLYAMLKKPDEVRRIWKVCESDPRINECIAAIEAWGMLQRVEEAEAIFSMMLSKWNKKISSRHYTALLKTYANNKMVSKGKDLIKQMADCGCRIGPVTWDALVKLYVQAGEIEKADSMLLKATQQNPMKPLFNSFITIMDQYARRGDIHNAEKMFYRMKQSGYSARLRQFQALVQTYINAKAPAYGIRERMKADNIFPNKGLAAQLAKVDAFRKTAVSDLLD